MAHGRRSCGKGTQIPGRRADARSLRQPPHRLADGAAATPRAGDSDLGSAYSAEASADAFAAFRAAFFRASWRACSSTGTTTSGRSRPNLLA
jgi:hypothetical protein